MGSDASPTDGPSGLLSWQESFWPRNSSADKSIESFAIATTPFHEADDDGEFYMDENGEWLHRWVTKTEVRPSKAKRSDNETAKLQGTKVHKGQQEMEASALESSSSSSDSTAEQTRRFSGRPHLSRHSRSSFIPSDKANHRSPERVDLKGPPTHPDAGQVHLDMSCDMGEEQPRVESDVGAQNRSKEAAKGANPERIAQDKKAQTEVAKALSCPTSPAQHPIISPTQLAALVSPELDKLLQATELETLPALDDARFPEPSTARSNRPGSRRSSRGSRSWSTVQIRRAYTDDPYITHQRAVELFSQRPKSSRETGFEGTSDLCVPPLPPPPSQRTILAAEFLASKVDVQPRTSRDRPFSRAQSLSHNQVVTRVSLETHSVLNHARTFSSENLQGHRDSTSSSLGLKGDEAKVSQTAIPVLTDHHIALDWTHPETRARTARKRHSVFGKMKRFLSRSRSRSRYTCAGGATSGDADEYSDYGSVRRLRLQDPDQAQRSVSFAGYHAGNSDNEKKRTAHRPDEEMTRRGWHCFG